jgi:protein required for attachment to host cells
MKQDRLWALVLNATQARVLRGVKRIGATSEPELLLQAEHRHLSAIMADKPGRSFASVGGQRSAIEYASDPVRDAERAFAVEVVELLERHRLAGDFDRLAIIAAPEMLGLIRLTLTDGLRAITGPEVAKNLLHLSAPELQLAVAHLVYGT